MASETEELLKPDLQVRCDDLSVTARELGRVVAKSGRVFDRAGPARLTQAPGERVPLVKPLTPDSVVNVAHELARPVEIKSPPRFVTLPHRVARLYLALDDWGLRPLKGITTAPLLSPDGSMRFVEGYDEPTALWCCNVRALQLSPTPRFDDAKAALQTLRSAFRTFPFADAATVHSSQSDVPLVDLSKAPGYDESGFLVGLLTAICRASLPLAPGLLISAPSISGAGSGKGLLVRAACEIAFGYPPYAFNACRDVAELEKRIGSALIEAAPVLFVDNVNDTALRSDLLASTLTEPLVKVRQLGASRMLPLNPTAFVAVTGNGVVLGEDLVRRFVVVELDPRTENPESRPFKPGFLNDISARRTELLEAGLTIWRWGRQNESTIKCGRALGSYETWSRWVRDPLKALGCADPVERIAEIKGRDPERQRNLVIFNAWWAKHREKPVTAAQLSEEVQTLIDPHKRGRQYVASAVSGLAGTRVGGYVLTRQKPKGNWSVATYALTRIETHD